MGPTAMQKVALTHDTDTPQLSVEPDIGGGPLIRVHPDIAAPPTAAGSPKPRIETTKAPRQTKRRRTCIPPVPLTAEPAASYAAIDSEANSLLSR